MEINQTTARALLAHFDARREAILSLVRALVEAESPSGDEAGSREVVGLLVEALEGVGAVSSVERVRVEGFGEHLRVRAFDTRGEG
ncbi:MAG TPA: hypothetical protein VGV38_13590, partial [Pyrinomonadaceae bacterium]|nr:hypothetical protein [Pyrinomonadaceae bacterium]